jgi:hypothetical protein
MTRRRSRILSGSWKSLFRSARVRLSSGLFSPGRGGFRSPSGRASSEGVKTSPRSPLGIGIREMAERASGLRSRPT